MGFKILPIASPVGARKLNPALFRPEVAYGAEQDALAYWQFTGSAGSLIDIKSRQKLHRHIASVLVVAPGSGYTTAPAVVLDPIHNGFLTTSVSAGAIVAANITTTGWFDTPPALSLAGGGGSGGSLAALLSDAPSFSSSGLLLPDTIVSGLATEIEDTTTGFDYAVVQWPAASANSRMVFGSLTTGANSSGAYFQPSGVLRVTTRGMTDVQIAKPANVNVGDWVFIGVNHDGAERTVYVSGADPVVTAGQKTTAAFRLKSLGNTLYLNATWYGGLRFASFGIMPAQTADQVAGVIAREKNRMRAFGRPFA